ncbi:hypothetical protein ACL02S_17505 [Nocardia sp. 004]|uniref:hypothetical protein n=1 Tax=Nocardia sp. 004 TaxID=3385978 RepID=UPI00399EFDCF
MASFERPTAAAEPGGMDHRGGLSAGVVRERADMNSLRAFARSSPGRLVAIGVLLISLCLLAGSMTTAMIGDRQRRLDVLLYDTEPDAHSAHRLYVSLSIADAAASTAFIAGGIEPPAVRNRYSQALGEAAAELMHQPHAGSRPKMEVNRDGQLQIGIATGLPVYSGLVETARTHNRSGHSVGAAYLSEASNQMQTTLLPMAARLQERRQAAEQDAYRTHARPPWLLLGLLVLTLGALGWAQWDLARRWRRVFNPGLLLASAAILLLLIWTVTAGSVSTAAMVTARDCGMLPSALLAESRSLAQQARTREILPLARRDSTDDYRSTYLADTQRLADLLDSYPQSAPAANEVEVARSALARWQAAHHRMTDALDRGDAAGAATVATSRDPGDSAVQVQTLDYALEQGIDRTRYALRNDISRAEHALDFLPFTAMVLGILAAGCVGLGLWPRLREYQ